jgi:RNA polymerase sigma-70 factor (ECF subfamily)
VEGLSYEEIAKAMGTSIGTVRSRIHRGRLMLRKRMEGEPVRTRRRSVAALKPVLGHN